MNIKATKMIRGFLAFIATLLILYGVQFLWQNYSITMPLNKELVTIPGIQNVIVQKPAKINEPINISISLSSVSNFPKTYTEINEKIVQTLKDKTYVINIKGNENEELENLYSAISLYVEKSLIDGSFPTLVEKSHELANTIDSVANISIDDEYIYIHIAKGNNNLYKLVSRQSRGR
ncbi:hypothetical protein [Lutispora thermophila]|uniref:Uncharacterized protein n=1 Tax=Lutispora thermophila DSM 19022 TaxID=1122184 RepID=A0A1M6CBL8_9FIRM|nr:hypothetical protein [Lutispora thermophila]SHI58396.1 hypothetical protein SAMN02745176_00695 [Lutispora thermophila DSM 19022]